MADAASEDASKAEKLAAARKRVGWISSPDEGSKTLWFRSTPRRWLVCRGWEFSADGWLTAADACV